MKPIAIQTTGISKQYLLRHEKPTLVEQIISSNNTEEFWALKDINITIEKGEKVAILGPNGAGKTTLLKIISGITKPTKGSVFTQGRMVSLIELEAGFHPELTGEENIYLNGLIIGMQKNEIRSQFKKICKFADIGRFIDAPLYTFSEGMKLRLGFSIAIHANPDVLIIDEVISVGDEDFQEKTKSKIEEFFKLKKTVLVSTHWLEFVKKNCKRMIFFENGKLVEDGSSDVLKKHFSHK